MRLEVVLMSVHIVTIKHKGQITFPAELRKKYHLDEGDKLAIEDRDGELIIRNPDDVDDPSFGALAAYAYTSNPDPAEERSWVARHIAETADPQDE